MEAVSNSTVLIFLSKINRLDLLFKKYSRVIVPQHVKEEVLAKDDTGLLNDFIARIQVKKPKTKRDLRIGAGETEAIILCIEEKIKDFLSDDKRARTVARMLKLNSTGTIGILLWNLKRKNITKKECSELVDLLIKEKYFISTELYVQIKKVICLQ